MSKKPVFLGGWSNGMNGREKTGKYRNFFGEKCMTINDYMSCIRERWNTCGKLGGAKLFPYPFAEEYKVDNIIVCSEDGIRYVMHNGRKLFFPNYEDERIRKDYNQLMMEGDQRSPHCYFSSDFSFEEGMVLIDVGAAEGIISLDVVDKAAEIYMLECSKQWQNALRHTFFDYKEKAHIINKYAGAGNNGTTVTIDALLDKYKDKRIFIKIDIEGMEIEALRGCLNTIKNNVVQIAVACYHTNNQENELMSFFRENGLSVEVSDGVMLYNCGYMVLLNGKYERIEWPYFRHGIIRARNDANT